MPEIVITEFFEPSYLDDLRRDFDVHYDSGLWERKVLVKPPFTE